MEDERKENEAAGEAPIVQIDAVPEAAPSDAQAEAGPSDTKAESGPTDAERRRETQEKVAKAAGKAAKAAGKVAGKVARTVAGWSVKAYEKGGELYEQGKLELKVRSIDGTIAGLEKEIGKNIYNLWTNGRIQDRIVLDLLAEKLSELRQANEELYTTKELIENIKRGPEELPPHDPIVSEKKD